MLRWVWTVDDEVRPTALPISRTDGGNPLSFTDSAMNSRICRRLSDSVASVMCRSLALWPRPRRRLVGYENSAWRISDQTFVRKTDVRRLLLTPNGRSCSDDTQTNRCASVREHGDEGQGDPFRGGA